MGQRGEKPLLDMRSLNMLATIRAVWWMKEQLLAQLLI